MTRFAISSALELPNNYIEAKINELEEVYKGDSDKKEIPKHKLYQ